MRRLSSAVLVVAAVPVLIALPAATRPASPAHPVAPHLTRIGVAPTHGVRGVVADTGRRSTARFDLVGATWKRGSVPPGTTVQVRARTHGQWSDWTTLEAPDGGPDDATPDAERAAHTPTTAAEPVWVGDADGVQARVVDRFGGWAPADLRIVLVDGGSSAADVSPGPPEPIGGAVAAAAQSRPTIYTRAQWGADESLRLHACPSGPDYSPTIKMGFVHHTDGVNGYTQSQVPSIIRSIYAYHVESNGWCDIGYNFLVDRFGRIWEGRYGGITRAVIGAHTGGFNYDTFGTSLIGDFTSVTPSAAMLSGLEHLFAWKLGTYYLDPAGKATLVAASFSGSRYPAGSTVTFNVISGHRNADYTTCPGGAAYATLPAVRSAVRADMGAGLVAPKVWPAQVQMLSGKVFSAAAGVITSQSWTMAVANAQGVVVRTVTGSATPSTPFLQRWDLTDDAGVAVPPGTYTVTLSSQNADGVAAVPFSRRVTVTPPVTVSAPATAAYGARVAIGGTAVPGASVTLQLTDVASDTAATPQTVQASSAGAWSTSFVADRDWSWTAAVDGYTSPSGTTRVAPVLTSPPVSTGDRLFLPAGGSISLRGTALPGTDVSVATKPAGSSTPNVGAALPVGANGTWADPAALAPTTATSVIVQDTGRGVSSPAYVVYPVGSPTASAPATGWSHRWLHVTGNAGDAPVAVTVYTRLPGATSFALARQVTAATSGAFSAWVRLPSVTSDTTVPWKVVTGYGTPVTGAVTVQPTFAPTARPLHRVAYNSVHVVSGIAVPGDAVTVWTRPRWSTRWWRAGVVRAAADETWSLSLRFRRNTSWRVTSRTGVSPTRNTYVVPTIYAPRWVSQGSYAHLYGRALPGYRLVLYRERVGSTRWVWAGRLRVSSTGRWSGWRRLTGSTRFSVVSHRQRSRTVTVTVG